MSCNVRNILTDTSPDRVLTISKTGRKLETPAIYLPLSPTQRKLSKTLPAAPLCRASSCEKLDRRLRLLYRHAFSPSRDPCKGYNANFKEFYEYGLDTNETRNDGSVPLQKEGDSVAEQLWDTVSQMISFSSELMKELLDTIGVSSDELSPFCRSFQSLADLRNEYIRYLPHTFAYDGIRGGSVVEDEQDGGGHDDSGGHDSGSDDDGNNGEMNRLVIDRIERLAAALAGGDDGNKSDDDGDEVIEIDGSPPSPTSTDTTENSSGVNQPDQLMTSFRTLLKCFPSSNDGGDYLDHILHASASLANSEHVSGSISSARKAKSLVERWIARPVGQGGDKTSPSPEDTLIERDVIIMVNVKIGTGANATTVQRPFRVLDIYAKYYNKWYMSIEPTKKFRNEKKPFKVMARMLKVNAMNEYSDFDLYDGTFNKKDIVKNVEDKMILCVVGKLLNVG